MFLELWNISFAWFQSWMQFGKQMVYFVEMRFIDLVDLVFGNPDESSLLFLVKNFVYNFVGDYSLFTWLLTVGLPIFIVLAVFKFFVSLAFKVS